MTTVGVQVDAAVRSIRARISTPPRVGIVLGSGLGAFGDALEGLVKIPYAELPGFSVPNVAGHAGSLCFGSIAGVAVVCMQGRVHLYEGHTPNAVVHGVRTMARLGVGCMLITNAAGGLEASWAPGDLMVIRDHMNLTGQSPLTGPNDDTLGPRFPDMTHAYDAGIREAMHAAARETKLTLREGVYASLTGPAYETPAEVNMLRILGAQAVGMSTALEVVALRHMGVRVGALSCITNLAAGISATPLDHAEVETTAKAARGALETILRSTIQRLARPGGAS